MSKSSGNKKTALNSRRNNNNNIRASASPPLSRAPARPPSRASASPPNRAPARSPIRPSLLGYFYGRITREEAEHILKERGGEEGLYLLRDSISPIGNYTISLCHGPEVVHHRMDKQDDGSYMISGGEPFPGPEELIRHYQIHEGLATRPSRPCGLLTGQTPVAFRGITYQQLEKAMLIEAKKIKADKARVFGPMRDTMVRRVAATLHADMPWFHGKIPRQEAEDRLAKDKHVDGKFLVRQRKDKNTFALTLSYKGEARHTLVTQKSAQHFTIEGAADRFGCLMELVDNYHNHVGLACKLRMPCCRPGHSNVDYDHYMVSNSDQRESFSGEDRSGAKAPRQQAPPLPARRDAFRAMTDDHYEDVDVDIYTGEPYADAQSTHPDVGTGEELERDYSRTSFRKDVTTKKLLPSQIHLEDCKLGAGNFGSVMKGVYQVDGKEIPVAVKTLKKTELGPGVQCELTKEAEVMKNMDHKHIVRMIGLCEGETMMLVLELAKLGPLDTLLSKNKQVPLWNILELMWQVAQGMAYLEAQGFVHRDLAARNILLCDQHFAKVSDFGMSRALSSENRDYVSQKGGQWPIKWYAPDCIDSWKFDSKSDVWSFGVALWEAASYGAKPYNSREIGNVTCFVKSGGRLTKPMNCPEDVYEVMMECWTIAADDRPTFAQLVPRMEELYISFQVYNV